jgi:hypothetical protein
MDGYLGLSLKLTYETVNRKALIFIFEMTMKLGEVGMRITVRGLCHGIYHLWFLRKRKFSGFLSHTLNFFAYGFQFAEILKF